MAQLVGLIIERMENLFEHALKNSSICNSQDQLPPESLAIRLAKLEKTGTSPEIRTAAKWFAAINLRTVPGQANFEDKVREAVIARLTEKKY